MEQTPNTNERQVQGWQDIQIVPDMPLNAIIHFLNILNQRLCGVESNVFIEDNEGNKISLTELYALQAEEEMKAAQQEPELLERAE
jgi:hypothetical protein